MKFCQKCGTVVDLSDLKMVCGVEVETLYKLIVFCDYQNIRANEFLLNLVEQPHETP